MGQRYYFESNQETILPVDDGDYFTDRISADYGTGVCVLEFLDADGVTPVTPTGGTIVFLSSPIGNQYHEPSNGDGVIDATTVIAGLATYVMPEFNGPAIRSKMTLDRITGATYVRAYHWRDE